MRHSIISLTALLFLTSMGFAQNVKIEGPGPNWEWHQTDRLHGNVVVITVVSRYTEKESYFVNWKLGTRLRDGDFRMLTVIDFIGIPRFGFIYNIARKRISKETAGSQVEFICDTTEKIRDVLHADPRHRVDIIVLDRNGMIRGHFNGAQEIEQALKLIDELTER